MYAAPTFFNTDLDILIISKDSRRIFIQTTRTLNVDFVNNFRLPIITILHSYFFIYGPISFIKYIN